MDIEILHLGLGLVILIVVNIVLGTLDALFTMRFDLKKLLQGLLKGIIVVISFALIYLVGMLNPDVVAVEITSQSVNLMTAVQLILLAGFYHYAKQVVEKLMAMVSGSPAQS